MDAIRIDEERIGAAFVLLVLLLVLLYEYSFVDVVLPLLLLLQSPSLPTRVSLCLPSAPSPPCHDELRLSL
jgi:hypothetical protein